MVVGGFVLPVEIRETELGASSPLLLGMCLSGFASMQPSVRSVTYIGAMFVYVMHKAAALWSPPGSQLWRRERVFRRGMLSRLLLRSVWPAH